MLTMKILKSFKPGQIFLTGEIQDSPLGINIMSTERQLRWIACRGDILDWAIYYHTSNKDPEWIRSYGDKVLNKSNIVRLIPCDKETLAAYRY